MVQHHGIGSKLYNVLLELLRKLGYQRVYACITVPNPASIAFHKKFKFNEIGIFYQCGYKHQQWLDVMWMELSIGQEEHPKPIKSIRTMKNKDIFV